MPALADPFYQSFAFLASPFSWSKAHRLFDLKVHNFMPAFVVFALPFSLPSIEPSHFSVSTERQANRARHLRDLPAQALAAAVGPRADPEPAVGAPAVGHGDAAAAVRRRAHPHRPGEAGPEEHEARGCQGDGC